MVVPQQLSQKAFEKLATNQDLSNAIEKVSKDDEDDDYVDFYSSLKRRGVRDVAHAEFYSLDLRSQLLSCRRRAQRSLAWLNSVLCRFSAARLPDAIAIGTLEKTEKRGTSSCGIGFHIITTAADVFKESVGT